MNQVTTTTRLKAQRSPQSGSSRAASLPLLPADPANAASASTKPAREIVAELIARGCCPDCCKPMSKPTHSYGALTCWDCGLWIVDGLLW